MNPTLEQLFTMLTVPPGNLLYHLVLAFSITGALQAALHHWRESAFPQARRAMFGLAFLLLAQIVLFVISGLGWQGLLQPDDILPSLDRAIIAFSLIWIIWLWTFPEPNQIADSAAGFLSLLVAAGFTLDIVTWWQRPAGALYNGTIMDLGWQFISLGLVIIGSLLLLIRRPNGWGNGLTFIWLAAIGHIAQIIFATAGNFSGVSRLVYMAAYPMLLTLPQRFPLPVENAKPARSAKGDLEPIAERRRYSTEPKTLHALLSLASELDDTKIVHNITRAVAQSMLADLCFLIYLTEDNKLLIPSGYDLIREETLEGTTLTPENVPLLSSAVQRGRALRLPASSTSPDLRGMGELLGLSSPGHLLNVPIMDKDQRPIGSLLLLSPYSNRLWSAEDQSFLTNVSSSLLAVIQRGHRMAKIKAEREKIEAELNDNNILIEGMQSQIDGLRQQLESAEKRAEKGDDLTALAAAHDESQRIIDTLQQEIELLRAAKPTTSNHQQLEQLEHELRLTLEEVARLQNSLAETNMKLLESEKQFGVSLSTEQTEVIASISQELRQPMSSIIGYTDLLLGESVGILGALQRKFVERIKASTDRMGTLLDDLIQITTMESGLQNLQPEALDINLIIDNAMAYTGSQIREKNITLHLDIPKELSSIYADREAIQQILIHLLQNAGAASPSEGSISLRVRTEKEEEQDYVLIQIADTGGGISQEDLPRVFTRLYRADNVLIQGVGDTGVGLSIAKTLTEAQGGRIWVETETEVGATFSVLLPIAQNGQGG